MCTNKEDKKHVVDKSTATNEWRYQLSVWMCQVYYYYYYHYNSKDIPLQLIPLPL